MRLGAPGQHPAQLDGVQLDDLAVAAGVGAAGRAGQPQGEGLVVQRRPLGHDVGDEAAVVLGREDDGPPHGAGQVDPVHPHVAGEAGVEQVADRLPAEVGAEGLAERQQRESAQRRGHAASGCERRCRGGPPQAGERVGRQVGAGAQLGLVETVDPVRAADLGGERAAGPDLAHELQRRRLGLRAGDQVDDQGADVPARAVGRCGPVPRLQPVERVGEAVVLGGRELHRLAVADPRDVPDVGARAGGHAWSPRTCGGRAVALVSM